MGRGNRLASARGVGRKSRFVPGLYRAAGTACDLYAGEDLQDRRCEITGPAEAKMMINALNSGAKIFMVDLEDSITPNWFNQIQGQSNICEAYEKNLEFTNIHGKKYRLNENLATIIVRPRGWHLEEKNIHINEEISSGSLIDAGLYLFHNIERTLMYEFKNAFPKSITSLPVTYGAADLLKVTVNFNYDRYVVTRSGMMSIMPIPTGN